MDNSEDIKKYIGTAKYDEMGQFIWSVNNKDEYEKLVDIRGWGRIQYMFDEREDAAKFQDKVGEFIAQAINEKVQSQQMDEYSLGDIIRQAYLKHGNDSWVTIGKEVLVKLKTK